MTIDHAFTVFFAKSYGLFYLIGLSVAVLLYTFWPSNRKRFDRAAKSILDDESGPCQ